MRRPRRAVTTTSSASPGRTCQARSPGRSGWLATRAIHPLIGRQRTRSGEIAAPAATITSATIVWAEPLRPRRLIAMLAHRRSQAARASSHRSQLARRAQRSISSGSGLIGVRIERPVSVYHGVQPSLSREHPACQRVRLPRLLDRKNGGYNPDPKGPAAASPMVLEALPGAHGCDRSFGSGV